MHVHQFLEEYKILAMWMQYTDQQKACHVVDYVSPELKEWIYHMIPYKDEDWAALQAHLVKRFDFKDHSCSQQELEQLIKEKWWLEDVEANADQFNYLWHRAHGKVHDDEWKTTQYLEALPDELVWAASNDLHDGDELKPFEEVLDITCIRAKQILSIRCTWKQTPAENLPQKDNTSKTTLLEPEPCPLNKTEITPLTASALTDIAMLAEKFEKLALQ
ncbi:hypothetical protein EV182_005347, partial [Spiromyces aspiralis]